jgi:2-dehydro-3-deoxyphosphogalactonate aldolase
VVKAWRAVFPREVALLPVGGITPESLAEYWDAGANGFGLGSALFKPGMSLAEVTAKARAFALAAKALPRR